MTREDLLFIVEESKSETLNIFRQSTPVDTGYQKSQIYSRDLPDGGYEIVVNTDYVQYTTDPWTRGSNPNENWQKEAAYKAISRIKTRLR